MTTEFFLYEHLSWPEVAALPRNTPLIIPLGEGYSFAQLAETLSHPARAGLLPPLPYGWRGSALFIPEPFLAAYLSNLLHSLRDDGFSRVYALAPQGVFQPNHFTFPNALITLPTSQPSNQRATKSVINPLPQSPNLPNSPSPVLLIPIGHTEQHGHHLPLNVDTLIIDAIAQGTVAASPGDAITLPTFPYGVSTHRSSFAGTLNAGGRAFEDFWLAAVDVWVAQGYDKFYFMSGHGGNCSFLVTVVKYAGERHRRIFAATAWLHTSDRIGIEALNKYRTSKLGGMGHAGELETSMILHLRPDLVHMERCVDETNFVATPSYMMDWVEAGALVANPPWDDDTATGAYGAGSVATEEKGRLWLEAAIAEKVDHVREIHEQHARREARRNTGFGLWGQR
ncbi:MAG: creatininase family protein [Anaerolineales bacterium]|nr:creatininase family protein [Anaerolineales bacterium]